MLNAKVTQAVAAALALGAVAAAQAAPLPPATMGTVPAGNILYISGSTAISPALNDYMINSGLPLCAVTAKLPVVYTGTENGAQFNGVSCIASSALGTLAGQEIAIIKENNAGSKNGILPIEAPTTNPVGFPNPTATGFDTHCVPGPNPVTALGLVPYYPVTCDTSYPTQNSSSGGAYSALGYADVEAAIFGVPAPAGAGSSVVTPFGIVMNLGAYHALQQAEGLTTNDQLANMPTLSSVQLAGIFNGSVTDWTHVYGVSANPSMGAQTAHFGNSGLSGTNHVCYDGTQNSTAADCQAGTQASVAVAPHDTTIYFCERGQSSGTQNTDQIFFANQGCAGSLVKFLEPATTTGCVASGCTWSTASYGTNEVFAGNGQGDDLACLEAHDEQGQFAISFSSTDQLWGTVADTAKLTSKADWRFIRVDGYAPSNENIAAGKYDLWAQSAFYFASPGQVNYPSGSELVLFNYFKAPATQIGGPTVAAIDLGLERSNPTLDGGLLAIPAGVPPNSSTATLAQFRANPVNGFLRNSPSNNCQKPYLAPLSPNFAVTPTWDPPSIQ